MVRYDDLGSISIRNCHPGCYCHYCTRDDFVHILKTTNKTIKHFKEIDHFKEIGHTVCNFFCEDHSAGPQTIKDNISPKKPKDPKKQKKNQRTGKAPSWRANVYQHISSHDSDVKWCQYAILLRNIFFQYILIMFCFVYIQKMGMDLFICRIFDGKSE